MDHRFGFPYLEQYGGSEKNINAWIEHHKRDISWILCLLTSLCSNMKDQLYEYDNNVLMISLNYITKFHIFYKTKKISEHIKWS